MHGKEWWANCGRQDPQLARANRGCRAIHSQANCRCQANYSWPRTDGWLEGQMNEWMKLALTVVDVIVVVCMSFLVSQPLSADAPAVPSTSPPSLTSFLTLARSASAPVPLLSP